MQRNEQRLAALRKLATRVAPLKLRRLPPSKTTPALSLCDWADRDVRPYLFYYHNDKTKRDNKNNWLDIRISSVFPTAVGHSETRRDAQPQVQCRSQELGAANERGKNQNPPRGLFHDSATQQWRPRQNRQVRNKHNNSSGEKLWWLSMCSFILVCPPSLDRDLRDLKKRRSALITSLKSSTVDGVRPQRAGQTCFE